MCNKLSGEWTYSSTIVDLDAKWRIVASFTPRPLCPQGKSPRYPLCRRLGGSKSRSRRCGEEKNLLPLPEIEPRFPGRALKLYASQQEPRRVLSTDTWRWLYLTICLVCVPCCDSMVVSVTTAHSSV
jgi:hypothetical protein